LTEHIEICEGGKNEKMAKKIYLSCFPREIQCIFSDYLRGVSLSFCHTPRSFPKSSAILHQGF